MPANSSTASVNGLAPEHAALVRSILMKHVANRQVRAFGSRVVGGEKPMSDLDLCVMGKLPVPLLDRARLSQAFGESTLPFKVDVAYWTDLTQRFQKIVTESSVLFVE